MWNMWHYYFYVTAIIIIQRSHLNSSIYFLLNGCGDTFKVLCHQKHLSVHLNFHLRPRPFNTGTVQFPRFVFTHRHKRTNTIKGKKKKKKKLHRSVAFLSGRWTGHTCVARPGFKTGCDIFARFKLSFAETTNSLWKRFSDSPLKEKKEKVKRQLIVAVPVKVVIKLQFRRKRFRLTLKRKVFLETLLSFYKLNMCWHFSNCSTCWALAPLKGGKNRRFENIVTVLRLLWSPTF